MGKRKSKNTGCGWAVVVFICLVIAGPLAPLIALVIGVTGIIYVVNRLRTNKPINAGPRYSYNPANQLQIGQFQQEVSAIQKKMGKPGLWKTQVERIREAAQVKARISRTASQASSGPQQFQPLSAIISQTIETAARDIIPVVNRHFIEQTEKLQAMKSHARVVKSGKALLDQLNDIAAIDPAFANIAATLALPIRDLCNTAHHTSTLKARTGAALAAERAGNRHEALSEYLKLLYELKTDNIDDDDQITEITDLEDRVRRVVLSYGNRPIRKRTNAATRPSTPEVPNS